jgi:predicted  nucleic acid-binding Zn-ribbon protein
VTPDDRLEAIFARLGDIEKNSAAHHARVEGEMARIGDRIDTLAERIKIQNGRVTAAEQRLSELETKARIEEHHDEHQEQRHDVVAARMWAFMSGAGLVMLGAVLGYFL